MNFYLFFNNQTYIKIQRRVKIEIKVKMVKFKSMLLYFNEIIL